MQFVACIAVCDFHCKRLAVNQFHDFGNVARYRAKVDIVSRAVGNVHAVRRARKRYVRAKHACRYRPTYSVIAKRNIAKLEVNIANKVSKYAQQLIAVHRNIQTFVAHGKSRQDFIKAYREYRAKDLLYLNFRHCRKQFVHGLRPVLAHKRKYLVHKRLDFIHRTLQTNPVRRYVYRVINKRQFHRKRCACIGYLCAYVCAQTVFNIEYRAAYNLQFVACIAVCNIYRKGFVFNKRLYVFYVRCKINRRTKRNVREYRFIAKLCFKLNGNIHQRQRRFNLFQLHFFTVIEGEANGNGHSCNVQLGRDNCLAVLAHDRRVHNTI